VREILRNYPPWAQPLEEPESLGGAGGLSGVLLVRYRSARGLLVLRGWAPHGPGREMLERVHHWLSLAADLEFIPVPIPDASGRSLQEWGGRLWEVSRWMSGTAELSPPPATGRVQAALCGLAALHQHLAREEKEGTSPGLRERADAICRLMEGGFDALDSAIDKERQRDTCIQFHDAASRWVKRARPIAPRVVGPLRAAAGWRVRLQPCLRDARPEHFLFDGDRLSGLVDFGAMGVESVSTDLARLLGEWLPHDSQARALALAAYERFRPLDHTEMLLLDAFETASSLLIGERWTRWHYLEHRHFDDPRAIELGLSRGLLQLDWLDKPRQRFWLGFVDEGT
jgi:homoserine kinase type II